MSASDTSFRTGIKRSNSNFAMRNIIACFTAFMMAAFFMNSCKKSDLHEYEPGYHCVRIYDDTLADPRNHSIRIAAGNGRLLMTYGRTFEQLLFVMPGSATLPPPSENAWMLTDNDGNLFRQDTFPSGLSIGDAIALPDNSFLIVFYTGIPGVWSGPEWAMYMMHLDAEGVPGPVIRLNPPVIFGQPFGQLSDIHLVPAPSGNAVLHVYYQGQTGSATYIGEMDTQGSFSSWYREVNDPIKVTSCVPVPGGGYMAAGPYWNPVLQKSDVLIMKTNSTFDSIWSRKIVIEGWAMGIQIITAGNGNYLVNYSAAHDGKDYFHLLEINDTGDIVDSTSWPIPPDFYGYGFSSMMLQQGTTGVFITHSINIGNAVTSVSNQFNTNYVSLDAELNITKTATFQEQTSDMLNSGCRTSDGRIACFGITQTYDRRYYKPELIIFK